MNVLSLFDGISCGQDRNPNSGLIEFEDFVDF